MPIYTQKTASDYRIKKIRIETILLGSSQTANKDALRVKSTGTQVCYVYITSDFTLKIAEIKKQTITPQVQTCRLRALQPLLALHNKLMSQPLLHSLLRLHNPQKFNLRMPKPGSCRQCLLLYYLFIEFAIIFCLR